MTTPSLWRRALRLCALGLTFAISVATSRGVTPVVSHQVDLVTRDHAALEIRWLDPQLAGQLSLGWSFRIGQDPTTRPDGSVAPGAGDGGTRESSVVVAFAEGLPTPQGIQAARAGRLTVGRSVPGLGTVLADGPQGTITGAVIAPKAGSHLVLVRRGSTPVALQGTFRAALDDTPCDPVSSCGDLLFVDDTDQIR